MCKLQSALPGNNVKCRERNPIWQHAMSLQSWEVVHCLLPSRTCTTSTDHRIESHDVQLHFCFDRRLQELQWPMPVWLLRLFMLLSPLSPLWSVLRILYLSRRCDTRAAPQAAAHCCRGVHCTQQSPASRGGGGIGYSQKVQPVAPVQTCDAGLRKHEVKPAL